MQAPTNQLVDKAKKFAIPATLIGSFVLGAALFVGHGGVHAAGIDNPSPLDDNSVAALTALDKAMESVTQRVTPAVVNIAVTARVSPDEQQQQGQMQGLPPGFAQFFGFGGGQMQPQPQIEHGVGSGVIISPDGYIVTNNHVVKGATQIKVTLHDRRVLNAKLIGTDKLTDLAIVKIDASNLPTISWGDSSKLEPGQTVLAFGSPFGYFQFSVTRGIVSAVNRQNPYSDDLRKPGGYIQTDAAINPGNSGGPLVNAHGQLIGINTFIISDNGSFAGAGFAIPSQTVHAVADQLIKTGKVEHGYLGISIGDITPDNAHFFKLDKASGALISQVTPDSPASRAGLKTGDVIVSINGQPVDTGSALQLRVSELTPGTAISLGIVRDGKTLTINATVGQYHGKSGEAAGEEDNGQSPAQGVKLGVGVTDLTDDIRQQLNVPDQVHGVVIQSVRPGSPADEVLQRGDIVLEINRIPVTSADQFIKEVHNQPADKDVLLLVWEKGNTSYRTLRPDTGNNTNSNNDDNN
ncbi:Do family serine endopeptidase [Silvibacterium dinghuense]|uniref:Do family serine endopeptidase n=1 Tax=Silvibacterium dinghuense TaxID=1560006 RepID=A0A4V1NVR2_9BACT|nr:Do family serine endopeptidase [Silvibacterium dinghuense]RXS96812.1 Do family serine endopeptidase [Silvibacterium dinghuense]GGG93842.1 serine protease [Silvibacterium dinghuense]